MIILGSILLVVGAVLWIVARNLVESVPPAARNEDNGFMELLQTMRRLLAVVVAVMLVAGMVCILLGFWMPKAKAAAFVEATEYRMSTCVPEQTGTAGRMDIKYVGVEAEVIENPEQPTEENSDEDKNASEESPVNPEQIPGTEEDDTQSTEQLSSAEDGQTLETPVTVVTTASQDIKLSLKSKSAIVMNLTTGGVIYGKKAYKKRANASTTKLLTALVAAERMPLNIRIKISRKASLVEPQKLYVKKDDALYLKDLMYSMLMRSDNDCAIAVAEGTAGNVKAFMKEANERARELGCTGTHFATPNGLDAGKNHYSTAYDMALITRAAYENPTVRSMMRKKTYSFRSKKGRYYKVYNLNPLLKKKKYYCPGKTGFTYKAGYCFAGVYHANGHDYVLVTLGAATSTARWEDVYKMMDICRKLP